MFQRVGWHRCAHENHAVWKAGTLWHADNEAMTEQFLLDMKARGDGFKRIGCCTTLLPQGPQAVATRGHTEAKQQQTTRIQCTQQPAKPARDTPESLMLVAAARRSAAQSGKSSTN